MVTPSASKNDPDTVRKHLQRFEELDFQAFNRQDWKVLNPIYAEDVVVTFPDGHQAKGIEQHDREMKAMFAWAPDVKVSSHPVKLGYGDSTAVTGVLTGTFTQPMQLADGTVIPPTGNKFTVPMCTVARWRGDRISEEVLFWDSGSLMQQIGVTAGTAVVPPVVAEIREDF